MASLSTTLEVQLPPCVSYSPVETFLITDNIFLPPTQGSGIFNLQIFFLEGCLRTDRNLYSSLMPERRKGWISLEFLFVYFLFCFVFPFLILPKEKAWVF